MTKTNTDTMINSVQIKEHVIDSKRAIGIVYNFIVCDNVEPYALSITKNGKQHVWCEITFWSDSTKTFKQFNPEEIKI